MAKKVSGITVAIDCDASAVEQGLGKIQNSVIKTQTELKQLNSALKLDPKNTELLAEKQKALKQQIEQTSEKLKVLKGSQDEVNKAFEENKINREQWTAFQKELAQTEKNLKSLKEEAQRLSTEGLERLGKSLQDVGGKVESAGKSMMGLSATVGAIGVAGLKIATDFEAGMSQVQAITNATEEEFEALRQQAIDLGASTAFSSAEVADAMTEMAKAGWTTQQILDGLGGVLSATSASGETLASVSTIVADAITGFGLSAEDSSRVADLLTQSANSGTIGISELGESFKYVAPVAKALNISIEDATTAISAMSMSGIKGSQAGTALRTVLSNLSKPSKQVAEAMDELNIEITNADGSFKSLDEILSGMRSSFSGLTEEQTAYYASALAGKEGMSGLLSLMTMTQDEYDALSSSMNNCGGVAEQTASIMQDNLQAKLEQLMGALESLAIVLSDNVIPWITNVIETVTGWIEKFTEMDESTQKIILIIGGLVTAIGPLLIIVGKMIAAFGTAITTFTTIMPIIKAVGTFFAGLVTSINPVILIIGALIAIIVTLWNKCDWFREMVTGAINAIWGALQYVWGLIKPLLTETIPNAFNALANINLWEAGSKILTSLWDGAKSVWGEISGWFSEKISWISEKISWLWNKKSEADSIDVDGKHFGGLSYVPYDGYVAMLHKGERVLTANENQAYSGGAGAGGLSVVQNIYVPTDNPRELERQAKRNLVKLGLGV